MTGAIVGFEMRITAWRPTVKLSQNKSADERARVIAGLEATGHSALARLMRHFGGDREDA
jgi:transcriptional regulator